MALPVRLRGDDRWRLGPTIDAEGGTVNCMPRLRRVAIATACCAAVSPSSALAQEEDAVVDRDSPAGREYVIPLEGARRDAAPATGNSDRGIAIGDRSASLFGAGITPPRGANGGSGSGGGSSGGGSDREARDRVRGRSSGDASRGGSARNTERDGREDADSESALGQRSEGGDSASSPGSSREARLTEGSPLPSPWVIAAAVLLLGALAGILGRKLRRPST